MEQIDSALLGYGLATQRQALALSRSFAEHLDPDGLAVALSAGVSRPGPSTQRMSRSQVQRHVDRYTALAEVLRPR